MLCALVECSTRFTMLLYVPNGHAVVEVDDVIIDKCAGYLTPCVCCSGGTGAAIWLSVARLPRSVGFDVYLCDPHSLWQCVTNENTNGLLHELHAQRL